MNYYRTIACDRSDVGLEPILVVHRLAVLGEHHHSRRRRHLVVGADLGGFLADSRPDAVGVGGLPQNLDLILDLHAKGTDLDLVLRDLVLDLHAKGMDLDLVLICMQRK